jgi:hypothetical protein
LKLGYQVPEDVHETLNYIRDDAPIIIHIHCDKVLNYLIQDTHYRNQFETKTSSGALDEKIRTAWEDNLFNKIYHDSPPFERVKYGVLNVTNDKEGVRSCWGYGYSYLVLKLVRLRTTFANMDTGGAQ